MNSSIITNAGDAKFLVLSGYKFNVVDGNGQRFTYSTTTPSDKDTTHWVRECSDPQNEIYIGTIFDMENFRITKGVKDPRIDEVKLFESFWEQAKIPIGDMMGFHAEPYDERGLEAASPMDTPRAATPSDTEMGNRAIKLVKLTQLCKELTGRISELESQVKSHQAQLDHLMLLNAPNTKVSW
jgi:hypothetical protein